MNGPLGYKSCDCSTAPHHSATTLLAGTKRTVKSIPSVALSVVVAFFPKCPLCWAVYMSMFSSLGLSRIPYMKWLLPLLFLFLLLHLFLLYKRRKKAGILPFIISIVGVVFIVSGRYLFPEVAWPAIAGIACMVAGSLLSSFLSSSLYIIKKNNPVKSWQILLRA